MGCLIRRHIFNQLLSTIAAFITIFTAGFGIQWIAVVLPKFKDGEVQIPMTKDDLTWMIVLFDLGTLIVPPPSGYLMDRFGRLFCLRLSCMFSLLSAALAIYATSANQLWAARFIAGMSKGMGFSATTLYVAEIAGPKIRGTLNGLFITNLMAGGIIVAAIGPSISFGTLNYITLIFPIVQLICLFFAIESPYYFFIRNKDKLASTALSKVRDKSETGLRDKELELIRKSVEDDMKRSKSFLNLWTEKSNRKALLIVMTLAAFQRIGGGTIIATYATTTLPSNEFWKNAITHLIFVLNAFTFSLVSLSLVDWCGRKTLLIISCLGTSLVTGISAVFYYYHQLTDIDVTRFIFVPHVCVMIFPMFWTMGIGPVTHTLQGEMFSTSFKGQASAIVTIALGISNFAVHKVYRISDYYVGVYFMYLVASVCGIVSVIFTIFCVIETKGKSLVEIQNELNRKVVASPTRGQSVSGQESTVAVLC